jgi:hypothetical protein
MLDKVKKGYELHFKQQPLYIKYILLLTVSVFLPLYVTVPVILAAGGYFILNSGISVRQTKSPYFMLYALLGIIALAVPLVYKNYPGFGCGILMIL